MAALCVSVHSLQVVWWAGEEFGGGAALKVVATTRLAVTITVTCTTCIRKAGFAFEAPLLNVTSLSLPPDIHRHLFTNGCLFVYPSLAIMPLPSLNNSLVCPMQALLLDSVILGIVFSRISHPKQRGRTVLISDCACMARRDGQLKL